MYLSNRDVKWAIECGKLIVDPPPEAFDGGYDETSIDLHLDSIKRGARIWDIDGYRSGIQGRGGHGHSEIHLGSFDWQTISGDYLKEVPEEDADPAMAQNQRVFRRGNEVVVRQLGFLLWTTKGDFLRGGQPLGSEADRGCHGCVSRVTEHLAMTYVTSHHGWHSRGTPVRL